MASRLVSRSLISSARSTFQSGGNAFRAARGRPASSNTRPPSSSDRNPLRNNSTNFRRRCAETMIPLHDAVAGAKLISHLAVNSRSRSALSLARLKARGALSDWEPFVVARGAPRVEGTSFYAFGYQEGRKSSFSMHIYKELQSILSWVAIVPERCCRWIWRVFRSNRGVVSEGRERLRSKESTNECSFAASLEEAEVFKDFSAHIGAH